MRELSLRAATYDAATRSVEAVVATENPVDMYGVDEVLLMSGCRLPASRQMVLLGDHQRGVRGVLGSIRDLRIDGARLLGRLCFADDDEAKRVEQLVAGGHLRDVSVGYRVTDAIEVPLGRTAMVAGRTWRADRRPLRVATEWTPREGSLTPVGADEAATVRAARDARREEGSMDEQKDAAPAPATDAEQARRDATLAERARITEIRALAMDAGVSEAELARAIDGGSSVDQARAAFWAALKTRRAAVPPAGPEVIGINRDRTPEQRMLALGYGLRHATGRVTGRDGEVWVHPLSRGRREIEEAHRRAADDGAQYRGMSAVDLLAEGIEICTGQRAPRGAHAVMREAKRVMRAQENARDALSLSGRAAVSTLDLANVFTTTFEAQLVMSYEEAADTADWVREVDVPNFNMNERPRMEQLDHLELLARGDTAKHATLSDTVESYKAYRFAKQVVFDEQDVIDDRLDALTMMPQMLGIAARRVKPDLVYYILANGESAGLAAGALFSSGNANLGSSGTLAHATLQAGIQAMLKQRENAVNLNIMPRYLLVPVALLHTARQLVESTTLLIAGTAGSVTTVGSKNVLFGALEVRADARLDNGVVDPVSGSTSTADAAAWYLAADPIASPTTIEVGYVRATGRVPVVRSYMLERGQWGIGWDVKHDIGAKALDFRGLYKAND